MGAPLYPLCRYSQHLYRRMGSSQNKIDLIFQNLNKRKRASESYASRASLESVREPPTSLDPKLPQTNVSGPAKRQLVAVAVKSTVQLPSTASSVANPVCSTAQSTTAAGYLSRSRVPDQAHSTNLRESSFTTAANLRAPISQVKLFSDISITSARTIKASVQQSKLHAASIV